MHASQDLNSHINEFVSSLKINPHPIAFVKSGLTRTQSMIMVKYHGSKYPLSIWA